ncbi:S8 family serine peptidase [Rufibacter sp. H-1]|uniref:S8 family serine peptidase n=1 Tax=Rufibacter sediminis TaxID=2762756 RepID=A0ABR6VU12_9BACT|nr:S8 family serine peptidase [Rufibacter sediminis]MBC3540384.1 S8 family serine peptidase [Rufibacter sediminis]
MSAASPTLGQTASATFGLKLAPSLQNPIWPGKASTVRVQVNDEVAFLNWLRSELPEARLQESASPGKIFLLTNLPTSKLRLLAQCPAVTFIDVPDRVAREEAYLQNADFTVNAVEAVHVRYPQLHGKNLVVSVKENPFDASDIDFKGRIVPTSASAGGATPHATNMATLVAGGGNSAAGGRGVAWQSQLITSDFARLLPDETSFLRAQKVSVQNHSYGVGVENYYGLESQAYDAQVLEYPELLHVFSSGNSGIQTPATGPYAGVARFANLTGQFKTSKNTLSVGAVDTSGQVSPLSSRGPTFDGRIKPEVVAFGESGSSEASAVVSGIALLLQQVYQEQHNGALPSSALVKAALINSADDKGQPGLDYAAGFGNVDALGAVQAFQERRYFSGRVGQGEKQQFSITVPPGAANLKVTLVWHDAAAQPTAVQALVSDLDLTLQEATTGREWLPWGLSSYPHKDSLALAARRKVDRLNNVEQVTLASPAAGNYQIQVAGYHVSPEGQSFSIVYEMEAPFTWTYPSAGSTLKSGQKNRLRWQTRLTSPETAHLEFRWAGQTWQTILENVPLQEGKADWLAPYSAGVAQLRWKTSAGEVMTSEEFILSPEVPLQVGYNCDDEVLLFWPKAKDITAYQVFALGEKFLEPIATVSDTLLFLDKQQQTALHYAVAPVVAGQTGLKSFTLNYVDQGVGCYVKQFLARQLVTDSVLLDVELSTLYGISSVVLEKRDNGTFQPVQAPLSLFRPVFTITDPKPTPGRNEYRLKLLTDKGAVFYSDLEAVFYTPPAFIQVFPNPVVAGNDLQLVSSEDKLVQIQLYDYAGRIVKELWQDGAIKVLKTDGLKAGVYLVKLLGDSEYKVCRVVVL